MDGGIDAVYVRHFGPGVERAVQDAIARRPGGLVPVGAAVLVGTGDARIPYLIAAPTMEAPQRVEAQHCYRATRAALRVAREHSALVSKLFFPGMGTGVGAVPPQDAAQEMAAAYADWQRAE
jgi:O-acetyl-ADP-ribose deacetylase (regulator of RNase III)